MCLFPDLVGQTQLKSRIRALMWDDTSRALLLVGPKGIGKKSFGRSIAQLLLCKDRDENGFCGVCNNCNYFKAGTHPDYTELVLQDGDKNIRVSAVRQKILSDLWLFPQISDKKVYLIQADDLNEEGQNALLKTLEEPPDFAYFILTVADTERLQKTVISRMTVLPVQYMPEDQIVEVMKRHVQLNEDELHKVARHAQGIPGQAIQIAQDESYDELKVIVEDIFFSLPSASKTDILTDVFQVLDTNKKDIELILSIFQRLLGELLHLYIQSSENARVDSNVSRKINQMLQKNKELKIEHIQQASEAVTLALRAIKGNGGFEVTICRMLLVIKKELTHA